MPNPKVAFLFGAGASYGAERVEPVAPPLGVGLYEALLPEFPSTWGDLRDDEKLVFGGDGASFEAGMKMLWENFDGRGWAALRDMGIYFSRFRPPLDQSDCYSRLVIALRALGLIECARVALNYECVLEIASCRVGVNVSFSREPDPGRLAVAKPHGSCNFLAKANMQNVTLIGSPEVQNLLLAETEIIGNLDEIEPKYTSGYSIPPVMSLFEPTKQTPINAALLVTMRDNWREWAKSADVIVVVGAQPHFEDAHIWNPVVESSARVWYIGGSSGDYGRFADELGDRLDRLGDRFAGSLGVLLTRLRQLRDDSLVVAPRSSRRADEAASGDADRQGNKAATRPAETARNADAASAADS